MCGVPSHARLAACYIMPTYASTLAIPALPGVIIAERGDAICIRGAVLIRQPVQAAALWMSGIWFDGLFVLAAGMLALAGGTFHTLGCFNSRFVPLINGILLIQTTCEKRPTFYSSNKVVGDANRVVTGRTILALAHSNIVLECASGAPCALLRHPPVQLRVAEFAYRTILTIVACESIDCVTSAGVLSRTAARQTARTRRCRGVLRGLWSWGGRWWWWYTLVAPWTINFGLVVVANNQIAITRLTPVNGGTIIGAPPGRWNVVNITITWVSLGCPRTVIKREWRPAFTSTLEARGNTVVRIVAVRSVLNRWNDIVIFAVTTAFRRTF